MKKEKIVALIEAGVILVIGILFCLSEALGIEVLSTIFGVTLIVGGTIYLAISLVVKKGLISIAGFTGGLLISLGILSIVTNIMALIFAFLPYFLIVIGSLVLIDAFLGKFVRNDDLLVVFVLKLVIGAVLITLGILLLTVAEFARFASIIFGASLIVISIYYAVMILMDKDPVKTVEAK